MHDPKSRNIFQPGINICLLILCCKLSGSKIAGLEVLRGLKESVFCEELRFHILAWTTYGTGLMIESTKTGTRCPDEQSDFRLLKDAKG